MPQETISIIFIMLSLTAIILIVSISASFGKDSKNLIDPF